LGTGSTEQVKLPVNITDKLGLKSSETVVQISLGFKHAVLLLNSGESIAFGSNEFY
jgi:alpha-tubulin suppressor-like RCC1 family protein